MLLFLTAVGSYPSSVSNSLEASKLAINQPVATRREFNQRYFADLLCMLVCLMRFFFCFIHVGFLS